VLHVVIKYRRFFFLNWLDIATAVAMTFQSIEAPILQGYVHLKGQAFSDFVKAQGWSEANGVVSIPINKDNEAKTTVLTENIKFERKGGGGEHTFLWLALECLCLVRSLC
jgi:hypothetical protein